MPIIAKDIKKEDMLCIKSQPKERHNAKDFFQVHPPVSSLHFSNNISVPKVRINIRETGHDTTFEIF